ncbi:hypothetical protein [Advenella kashmirensis]|nr:hypothetical protein [Advenella kashmirensis]
MRSTLTMHHAGMLRNALTACLAGNAVPFALEAQQQLTEPLMPNY